MHEQKRYKGITTKRILKAIGCPHLDLARGDGYYFWRYNFNEEWSETQNVYSYALSHTSFETWVKEGKDFADSMEIIRKDPDKFYWDDQFEEVRQGSRMAKDGIVRMRKRETY